MDPFTPGLVLLPLPAALILAGLTLVAGVAVGLLIVSFSVPAEPPARLVNKHGQRLDVPGEDSYVNSPTHGWRAW